MVVAFLVPHWPQHDLRPWPSDSEMAQCFVNSVNSAPYILLLLCFAGATRRRYHQCLMTMARLKKCLYTVYICLHVSCDMMCVLKRKYHVTCDVTRWSLGFCFECCSQGFTISEAWPLSRTKFANVQHVQALKKKLRNTTKLTICTNDPPLPSRLESLLVTTKTIRPSKAMQLTVEAWHLGTSQLSAPALIKISTNKLTIRQLVELLLHCWQLVIFVATCGRLWYCCDHVVVAMCVYDQFASFLAGISTTERMNCWSAEALTNQFLHILSYFYTSTFTLHRPLLKPMPKLQSRHVRGSEQIHMVSQQAWQASQECWIVNFTTSANKHMYIMFLNVMWWKSSGRVQVVHESFSFCTCGFAPSKENWQRANQELRVLCSAVPCCTLSHWIDVVVQRHLSSCAIPSLRDGWIPRTANRKTLKKPSTVQKLKT